MFRKSDVRSHHTAELLAKIQLHVYRRFVLYINVFRLSLSPGRAAQGWAGMGRLSLGFLLSRQCFKNLICDLTTQLNCKAKCNFIHA